MKAKELMIGDWVYAIDTNGEKHPCRANNLEYDYTNKREDFCVDFYGTGYEAEWPDITFNVEPIPLTPEILEKNGFRLTKADSVCPADRYWWAIDGTRDGAMVEITLYNPNVHGVKVLTKIHTQSSHESGVNTVHSCDIESVHELQHALRLCRIDKEIVL